MNNTALRHCGTLTGVPQDVLVAPPTYIPPDTILLDLTQSHEIQDGGVQISQGAFPLFLQRAASDLQTVFR